MTAQGSEIGGGRAWTAQTGQSYDVGNRNMVEGPSLEEIRLRAALYSKGSAIGSNMSGGKLATDVQQIKHGILINNDDIDVGGLLDQFNILDDASSTDSILPEREEHDAFFPLENEEVN